MLNVLSFIDGDTDLIEISSRTGLKFEEVVEISSPLKSHKIMYDNRFDTKNRG